MNPQSTLQSLPVPLLTTDEVAAQVGLTAKTVANWRMRHIKLSGASD